MKRNLYILTYLSLIICLHFSFIKSYSQSQSEELINRKTQIDSIFFKGKILKYNENDELILSTKDSIIFYYSCLAKNGKKNPFLFRIKVQNGLDSSNHTYNGTIFKLSKMPEHKYSVTIVAFDPYFQWEATPAIIHLEVNNKFAALKAERDSLKKLSLLNSNSLKSSNETNARFTQNELLIYAAGFSSLILILSAITFFFIKNNKKKNNQLKKIPQPNQNNSNTITLQKNEYNKILSEGSNLKAEIASLRGQIDAMQMRSLELSIKNKELEDSVQKLTKSKLELEELQKQKDELFAIIIHDIKNPAALIKSLVELLRSYDLTATEQQEIISDIVETTSRIVSLSQEVSRILALEGGRIKLELESAPISEIIKDSVRSNNIHAKNKGIQIYTDIEDGLPDIDCDPQKIQEVIDNLLSNAIKFTHKGGIINIRTYKNEDSLIVDVSDNGLGLTEEDIKSAFQRGAQLSAKPTAGEPTTGLGLWIVKKLIDAHHGRVWVRSVLGKGSTFSFSLPLVFVDETIE